MPAPANDNFANAIALSTTLPSTLTGQTTVDATYESGEPIVFGGNEHRGVWYTFTPTVTGRYKFSCDVSSTVVWTDIRMSYIALFTGSAVNALTLVKRQDNGGNSNANAIHDGDRLAIEADLVAGTTYRIRVGWRWFTGEGANAHSFNFGINVESMGTPSAPANDNIANAQDLGTNPADGVYSGTLRGATDDASPFDWGSETAWIKFVAGATGSKQLYLVNPNYVVGTDYIEDDSIPYAEIYRVTGSNPPTSFSDLTYVNDFDLYVFPETREYVTSKSVSLIAGATYYVLVYPWHYNSGLTFDYELQFGTLVLSSPPDNDDVANFNTAEFSLGRNPYYIGSPPAGQTGAEATFREGTTEFASAQAGEPSKAGFAATRSVWYTMQLPDAGPYKVWVESAVDCVLAIFDTDGLSSDWHGITFGPTTLLQADDDSGPGNQPELTVTPPPGGKYYYVAVDSKTEGEFSLHFEKIKTGTPPTNDDFADAEVLTGIDSASGTTVNSYAESREAYSDNLGEGPRASVWYKWTAPANGRYRLRATCDTNNDEGYVYVDLFKGPATTPDELTEIPIGAYPKGFFNHSSFATPEENAEAAIDFEAVNGTDYYFRVQTEQNSEDFTIYIETADVYLDLEASGSEEFHGTILDAATIYLDLQVSSVEDYHQAHTTDAATVLLDLVPSGAEFMAKQYVDSATVRIAVSPLDSHECFFHLEPSWTADGIRKWQCDGTRKWTVTGTRRWTWLEGEGQPQIC